MHILLSHIYMDGFEVYECRMPNGDFAVMDKHGFPPFSIITGNREEYKPEYHGLAGYDSIAKFYGYKSRDKDGAEI